jgi:hypothetical protein
VEIPLTAARKDAPVLGCYPADRHSIADNLRTRSHTRATNLILEDFVDPDRPDWNGFRLPQACVLPKRPQTWSS